MENNLIIKNKNHDLYFDVNFGYLDSSWSAFDYVNLQDENIENYILSIDAENASSSALRELEEILNEQSLFKVNLSLDGFNLSADAKIAQTYALEGVSLSLELHN